MEPSSKLKIFTTSIVLTLMAQAVENLPAMQETWVQSLGWEDPLEKQMATHSSYSCLENSMDRGAWWATVHGVTKSDKTEQLSLHLALRKGFSLRLKNSVYCHLVKEKAD